jgi:hypothetical protein
MQKFHGWKRVVWAVIVATSLASPVTAGFLSRSGSTRIVGADKFGSPSWLHGGRGGAKIMKDSRTGILVLIGLAIVRNDSSQTRSFKNLGLNIVDSWRQRSVTATSDVTALSRPFFGRSSACAVAVYNPGTTPQ